jgi:hypothetical protein
MACGHSGDLLLQLLRLLLQASCVRCEGCLGGG